jgi:hypothetical protein
VNHRSAIRVAALAFLLQLTSGCSWAFMKKPPESVAAPDYPVECTSSRAAPVIDTICAGYFAVNTLVLAGAKTCDSAAPGEACVESGSKGGGIALSVGLAALCAISAGSGYGRASKCQDVKNTNALCITGNEVACRQLNPSWQPRRPPGAPAPQGAAPPAPYGQPVAPAPVAPGVDTPVPSAGGCTRDVDCKGTRVCERGVCVEPGTRPAP